VTPGQVTGVDATVTVPALGCTVHVTGTTAANWSNTQVLSFPGGSTLNTSGSGFCIGLGSTGAMSGAFNVTADSPISIGAPPPPNPNLTVSGGPNFTSSSTTTTIWSGSVAIHCSNATATGSIAPGAYRTPATIGSITSTTWSGCTAYGATMNVTGTGTWSLVATGASSGGVTPGEITGVDMTWDSPALGCTVHVTGSTAANWSNTQVLSFPGGSTLNTSGSGFCIGWGSTGAMSGSFNVTGSPSAITVS
jgi:hypothetical protein